MGLFKVTKDVVLKLLSLVDSGLFNTAGNQEDNTFCVQQAVSLATGMPSKDDQPKHCVMPWIISLGISLNDADAWESDEDRSEGLREFAVAELGSAGLRESTFRKGLVKKVKEKWPERSEDWGISDRSDPSTFIEVATSDIDGSDGLKLLAKMAVEVLQEMSCQGTEYLFLANKKEYDRPEEFKGVRIPQIKPATEEVIKSAWIADDAAWEDPKPIK